MSPADLRTFLAALPWSTYTEGELNQIARVLSEGGTTVRVVRGELQRMKRGETPFIAETPEQAERRKNHNYVYPPGQRFE